MKRRPRQATSLGDARSLEETWRLQEETSQEKEVALKGSRRY